MPISYGSTPDEISDAKTVNVPSSIWMLKRAARCTRPPMSAWRDCSISVSVTILRCGYLVLDKLEVLFYDDAPGHQLGLAVSGRRAG